VLVRPRVRDDVMRERVRVCVRGDRAY
jgi:hypothetical protein